MQTANDHSRLRVHAILGEQGLETQAGDTVTAYINHGRWVADCVCNGAELVHPDYPMVCGSCGRTHQVIFPKPKDRARIEAALNVRPPYNQHWNPEETFGELIAQNIEHGLWEI